MLLQNQSMESHSCARMEKCLSLCKQYKFIVHLKKKRTIKWQRDLILSLFSSTEHWTLVRTSSRERLCECECSTGRDQRRANYRFILPGYQTEWPQKSLSAHNKKHLCFCFTSFFISMSVFASIAHLSLHFTSGFDLLFLLI